MTEPKVSIIMPAYNSEQTIGRAIKSVLSQTFANWELIIVDDGSTDKTKSIIKSFSDKDTRIIYKYQNNSGGCASPKNTGLKICSGEFITFLDSDDEYLSSKIEEQLKLFKNSDVQNLGLVGCHNFRIKANDVSEDKVKLRGQIYQHLLNKYFITTPGLIMITRRVLKEVGYFNENLKCSNDVDYFIRATKIGFGFDFVNKTLFKYYEHENSMTNSFSKHKKEAELVYIYENNFDSLEYYAIAFLGLFYFNKKEYAKSKKYFKASFKKKRDLKTLLKVILISNRFGITFFDFIIKLKNNI